MKKSFTIKNNSLILIGSFFVFIGVILIVFFLMNGQTVINDNATANVKPSSFTCSDKRNRYEVLSNIESDVHETTINLVSYDGDMIDTISLSHKIFYNDSDSARKARTIGMVTFSEATARSGLGSVESLNHVFNVDEKTLILNLLVKKKDLVSSTAPFLLLELGDNHDMPEKISDFVNNYKAQGFSCQNNQ